MGLETRMNFTFDRTQCITTWLPRFLALEYRNTSNLMLQLGLHVVELLWVAIQLVHFNMSIRQSNDSQWKHDIGAVYTLRQLDCGHGSLCWKLTHIPETNLDKSSMFSSTIVTVLSHPLVIKQL